MLFDYYIVNVYVSSLALSSLSMGMDRQITPSVKKRSLRLVWIILGVLLLPGGYLLTQSFRHSVFRIDRNKIEVATVVEGNFEEYITLTGSVEPLKTIQVVALTSGIVEEIFVEDGRTVAPGDLLFRLNNQDLQIDFMQRETALLDQLNNLRNTQITIENTSFTYQQQLAGLENAYEQAKMIYTANKSLYGDSLISRQEFETSRNTFHSTEKQKNLLEKTVTNYAAVQNLQAEHYRFSSALIRKSLETLRSSLDMLELRAPAAGLLTGLDVEIGQSIQKGQKVAEVDLRQGYRLNALVDELYISKLESGLRAEILFGGKTYTLHTHKIYPQVSNGQFRVDLLFDSLPPAALKYGQSLQIRLSLGDPSPSLLLKRGGFYQKTGGSWVYVLDGNKAQKRSTSFGRQNTDFLELLSGLHAGDQVIISSYAIFGNADIILLESNAHD